MKRRDRAQDRGAAAPRDRPAAGTPAGDNAARPAAESPDDESPGLPGFRRWGEVYVFVFVVFVLVVTGLAIFAAAFA